jgi:hypothetical protein
MSMVAMVQISLIPKCFVLPIAYYRGVIPPPQFAPRTTLQEFAM